MSKKRTQTSLFITAIAAVLCCFGCDFSFGGGTCASNPDHKAQSGCTCPCNNNTAAPACTDHDNFCCYDNGGSCKNTTTTTPKPDAGAAASLAPSNRDGVRGGMIRCFEKEGACTNPPSPVPPCKQFYERVGYQNFANTVQDAPRATVMPTLTVSAAFGAAYNFSFPPTAVPWGTLNPGQQQVVPVEIRALNSMGLDGPGLDPGANQCVDGWSFTVQLLNVTSLTLDSNALSEGLDVGGSLPLPFGDCTKGSGC